MAPTSGPIALMDTVDPLTIAASDWSCVDRQLAQIVAVADQTVERVELDLVIVLAAVKPIEVGDAVNPEQHRLAVDHEFEFRLGSAASAMRGYRLVQS